MAKIEKDERITARPPKSEVKIPPIFEAYQVLSKAGIKVTPPMLTAWVKKIDYPVEIYFAVPDRISVVFFDPGGTEEMSFNSFQSLVDWLVSINI